MMATTYGIAGRLAAAFIQSKLTPLFIVGSMALGLVAVAALPREEEPQIIVPMVDVLVEMPGATPSDVEQRITRPLEQFLWEVPGVEYVYSTSGAGQSLVVVRFRVDEPLEPALVRLNQKLAANADRIPPGVIGPLVKPRSIDDVPILAVTLWSARYGDDQLRSLAVQLRDAIAEVTDVSEVTIIGGRPRQVRVEIDPARLSAYGLDPLSIQQALAGSNVRGRAAGPVADGLTSGLEAGNRLRTADQLRNIVVSSGRGRSVFVRDVADVVDRDAEPASYVAFQSKAAGAQPAVTIAVAKRKGTNATAVADRVAAKLETLHGSMVPADVHLTVTRNYGESAADKSNELLWHMLLAVVSVAALVWLVLGRREAAVVLIAIPVTLALTLFTFYLYGYTLNRITLFALIFSVGILVDDAIVVVENIVRHARMSDAKSGGLTALTVRAINEVGNPTILATIAVVAAILPMAFVRGMTGPYMRPIPVGASAAMAFSLAVAFVVTPWAAVRLLKPAAHQHQAEEDRLTRLYRRVMASLISSGGRRALFLAGVVVLLLAAAALLPLGWVKVKMMPFDNKSDFQVMIDMPEGTALESTARVTAALASATLDDDSVVNVQQYVGVSAPYNFNGLVRHYFLRRAPHQADLQVNLVPKGDRSAQSHEVAGRVRDRLAPIARQLGATIQVAELPPGPPVMQTLVAEIYGPDPARRREVAGQIKAIFEQTAGVVDTDWSVEAPHTTIALAVDDEKAAAAGLSAAAVAAVVRMAGSGESVGLLHDERAREDVPIVIRLPRAARTLEAVQSIRLHGSGGPVAVGELTTALATPEEPSVHHKNLQAVTYVTADLAGEKGSPVYAILQMNRKIRRLSLPEGYGLEIFNAVEPFDTSRYAMKWDGEWQLTIEMFRDLGLAFAAVLVLIYLLVVGWFQSFDTPLLIMAAIPFSLVGILPAHAAMGAFFTATSMIGFIAGAGIVVRNSIILVDFIELRLRDGLSLEHAVVDAGAVRFRPMALTAAAMVVGAWVILFDPIFQGLAISLMAGEVASLLLSRMAVPVLYYMAKRRASTKRRSADAQVEVAA
jgi:multidrug efflux pump subunit AcrB